MTLPLTAKQERVWRYIKSCDRSPTYREMERALGSSKGKLSDVITSLKERGYVAYIPNRARSIIALNPELDLADYPTEALISEIKRRFSPLSTGQPLCSNFVPSSEEGKIAA
jgi:SOS-response transcriptional repressor LexA